MKKSFLLVILTVLMLSIVTCTDDGNNDLPDVQGREITTNQLGTHEGYDFEFWTDSRGAGSGRMVLAGNGTFLSEWKNTYNILFRMGKRYGSSATQTHTQIGEFTLRYGISHYKPVGTSYITVYGWTLNPLVEYYIVENWGPNNYKGGGSSGSSLGSVTIDGGTYDIYKTVRTQQPSIQGTQTFDQYWSIRRTRRSEGTISVSEHFKAWQNAGLNMNGRLYEVMLCVEAFGGDSKNASGAAWVHTNKLMVNGKEINE